MSEIKVITSELREGEPTEYAANEDIRLFDEWFQGLGNEPLSFPEKAILKTYLWFKMFGKKHGA